ncbi:MAG: cob(I)yrinic acid a,c-diamide adenosyltransferase [Thermoguttaceae bacterium]|nr:cob(I)yrinic acid a,c-diamide adenosyltransferase [Thermoguttaceae bacterium]
MESLPSEPVSVPALPSRPRVLLFTGDGKGKTTAALGMVLRAVGNGLHCRVVHFLKSDIGVGEYAALQQLGVVVQMCGLGFVPHSDTPLFARHTQAAQYALQVAEQFLDQADCDLLLLDEICGAIVLGLIPVERVTALLARARARQIIVLTGRDAPQALIDQADTVTEMRKIKHGYDQKIFAQRGVEL